MRHFAMGLLCAFGLSANATTLDYTVAKDPNGFNVYSVTKDTLKKLTGSPFGSSLVQFIGTDGSYIYDVTLAPPMNGPYYSSEVITYTISAGEPKQVAVLEDNAYASPCGSCTRQVVGMVASAEHLFMKMHTINAGSGVNDYLHVYHKHAGGFLSKVCDIELFSSYQGVSSITNIRVDGNELYTYVDYTDFNTQAAMTSIYDISSSPCKQVGTISQ